MKNLDYSKVYYAALHHAAHDFAPGQSLSSVISQIKDWHLKRKFSDIGYHFVIKGKNYDEARPLPFQGAHCKGYNHVSVGFCVAADLTKRRPTFHEVCAVTDAILMAEYEIGHRLKIVGHNDLGKTLCPGPDLVSAVQQRMSSFS